MNALEPDVGFAEIDKALSKMDIAEEFAHQPDFVMEAGKWLYDNDVTAARAVLTHAKKAENVIRKAQALQDLNFDFSPNSEN